MRIQHNISAINTARQLAGNDNAISKNLQRLSSGYRINSAADDAAGLAISEKMRSQINGLNQAENNAEDGISLVKTGEGNLNETTSILQRMYELANESSNGTYQDGTDRKNLDKELSALKTEIDRISTSTNFNKINLLDGSISNKGTAITDAAFYTTTAGVQDSAAATFTLDFAGKTGKDLIGKTITLNDKTYEFTTDSTLINSKSGNTAVSIATDAKAADIATAFASAAASVDGDTATGDYSASTAADSSMVTYTAANKAVAIKAVDARMGNAAGIVFQIGADDSKDQRVSLNVDDMSSKGLGVDDVSIGSQPDAQAALKKIQDAIDTVSSTRADFGALQNRLEHTVNNLSTSSENLTSAESRIRDVDMSSEMVEMTKNQILSQAATAMLAQANTQPQGVLQLLK